ncbi:MAG: PAS domain S-box protein, partial [Armatimonadota bacterium]
MALLTILLFYFRERRERFNARIAEGVKSLQDKEERLSCTLRSIGDAVISTDANGRVVAMNPVAEELTGLALSESAGLPISEVLNVVNTLTGDSAFIPVDEVLSTGEVCHLADHTTLIARDGTKRQIADSAAPICDSWGNITGVVLVFSDVTEQYRMRNELSDSEARLHTLVQTIPDLIWLKDKDGVFLSCNTKFQRFFGAGEADIVGKTDYDFVDRELADSFRENDLIAMAAGKPSSNEEWITFADDGQRVLLDTTKTPMFDSQGVLIGVLGIGRDITERKRAEAVQQEALDRLQKIASRVPGLVYQYQLRPDGSSCMPFASEALRDIFSISPDEVREDASKVFAAIHPDDCSSVAASIQASAQDLSPWRPEFRVKFDDGTIHTLYGDAVPQREADGSTLWHGFITDITERKQSEEALRESEERWQFALSGAGDGVWDWNTQTNHVFFSSKWKAMFGYAEDEVGDTLDDWDKRVHPEDKKQCYEDIEKHFSGET